MPDSNTFGDVLLQRRLDRGLSQEELATEAKVSVRAISDLERGVTRRPHRDTIRALALSLGLSTDDRLAFERLARQVPPRPPRPVPTQIVLPSPPTSLLGRDDDIAALVRLVRTPSVRLVTVTGVGGVGKTRLAIEVAWRSGFPVAHLVDLGGLDAPDQVPAAIAAAVGLPQLGVASMTAVAARLAATGSRLLVVDSAEHVPGLALDLARLLAACPGLTVLATSREPLRLQGEHLWPLGPLATEVEDSPAVALLVERARAVRPGFALSPDNATTLASLCRRLDGLPLAIELAAARLRMREPADVLASLANLADLETDAVDRPDRHRSLHATLAWTLRQLRPDEYRLLAVLSAFRGGAAMVHLRQLADGLADLDASVAVLVDAQLIAVIDRYGPRITMLDTIREVAADLVEAAPVRAAHAAHFAQLLRRSEAAADVDAELDNVRAAVDWIIHHGQSEVDVRLVGALSGYFRDRGYFPEAYRVLSALGAATEDPAARAHAQCGAGIAANESGEPAEALRLAELAAASFAVAGDAGGQCTALALLGNASKALGDYTRARAAHTDCLALARAHGVTRAVTVALNNLGTVAEDLGDYGAARAHYAESLAIKKELGDDRGVAVAHSNLGGLAAEMGEFAVAQDHLRQAADALEARGERHALAFSLAMRSQAELGGGDVDAARDAAERSRQLATSVEFWPGVGLALARLGDLARYDGDEVAAAELYREALNQPIGLPETIRTLERLAAATAASDPDQARPLLDEADRLRTTHHLPASPMARAVIDEVHAVMNR